MVLILFQWLNALTLILGGGSSRVKRQRATDTGGGLVRTLLLGFTHPTGY